MNVEVFVSLFCIGAGAIALWVDHRFPRLAPQEARAALLHMGISLAIGYLVVPLGMHVLLAYESAVLTLSAIFAIAFPAIVYALLAGLWMIRLATGALRGLMR